MHLAFAIRCFSIFHFLQPDSSHHLKASDTITKSSKHNEMSLQIVFFPYNIFATYLPYACIYCTAHCSTCHKKIAAKAWAFALATARRQRTLPVPWRFMELVGFYLGNLQQKHHSFMDTLCLVCLLFCLEEAFEQNGLKHFLFEMGRSTQPQRLHRFHGCTCACHVAARWPKRSLNRRLFPRWLVPSNCGCFS